MPRPAPVTRLLSVGYAGFATGAQLADALRAAGIERLVDVRALASSRRPGFSKTALAAALEAAGVEYVHMRELGNPREGRALYRAGRVAQGRAHYRRHLLGEARPALERLAVAAGERRCALMCVERDPAQCHRTVIVEELARILGGELDVVELQP
jgi:uncharacterized protein (DUF488 family)